MATEAQGIASQSSVAAVGKKANPASALGGDDFFKLLIAQLTNQDPLEPTSNQELLNQISSIREIELSTNLSNTLSSLNEQQRYGAAVGMIGHYVNGVDESGARIGGVVSAVRFDSDGKVVFDLEDGTSLSIDQVESVMDSGRAADLYVGRLVSGIDQTDPSNPRSVEGIVMGVTTDEAGRIILELDTGDRLRLSDVVDSADLADAESAGLV